MAIVDHFEELDRRVLTGAWSVTERQSLLCIVREIHRADGVYSPEERQNYDRLVTDLGVDENSCANIADSVELLRSDPRKLRLLYIWMAEAVLADGRYDEKEQDFLESICEKYLLPRPQLEESIKELQLRDVDEVLQRWLEETSWES